VIERDHTWGPGRRFGAPPVAATAGSAPALTPGTVGVAVGWLALGAAIAWQALAPASAERYALVPLLAGLVLFGLPHGALDHLVPTRLGFAWARRPLGVALYLVAYAGVAAAYLGLWLAAPRIAFAGFLVATVVHWGQGDLRFLELFAGRRRVGAVGRAVAIALRGAIPIAVPVLAFPETAEGLLATAARALAVDAATLDLSSGLLRASLLAGLALVAVVYVASAAKAWGSTRGFALDVGEVALLVTLFAFVPAYLAIGVYFVLWHSFRHLVRLAMLRAEDARAIGAGRPWRPVLRLARDLVPITVIALAFLGLLGAWAAPRLEGTLDVVALSLVWISALTMPHLVVVALMDVAPEPGTGSGATRVRCGADVRARERARTRQAFASGAQFASQVVRKPR
jgi:beta-carotene 15,15'-dioxygenase